MSRFSRYDGGLELRCGLNTFIPADIHHRIRGVRNVKTPQDITSPLLIRADGNRIFSSRFQIVFFFKVCFCTFGCKVFHPKFWLVKLLLSSSPWAGVCHHNRRSVFCANKANTNSGIYVFSLTCFSAPGKLRRSEEESERCKEDERPNLSCRRRHTANIHICTARRLIPQVQPRCCWCLYVCVACVLGPESSPVSHDQYSHVWSLLACTD